MNTKISSLQKQPLLSKAIKTVGGWLQGGGKTLVQTSRKIEDSATRRAKEKAKEALDLLVLQRAEEIRLRTKPIQTEEDIETLTDAEILEMAEKLEAEAVSSK